MTIRTEAVWHGSDVLYHPIYLMVNREDTLSSLKLFQTNPDQAEDYVTQL